MFKAIRRRLALRAEVAALDAEIAREPRPYLADPQLTGPGEDGSKSVVWRIPIPGRVDAYMTARGNDYGTDPYVVPVSAKGFYRAWLRRGVERRDAPDAPALRRDIKRHQKYKGADQGFSAGERSPVPLARVHPYPTDRGGSFAFTDGITRTLWLIANGATAFPIVTSSREEANQIAQAAGIAPPIRVADLVARLDERAQQAGNVSGRRQETPQGPLGRIGASSARKVPRTPRRPRSGGYEL